MAHAHLHYTRANKITILNTTTVQILTRTSKKLKYKQNKKSPGQHRADKYTKSNNIIYKMEVLQRNLLRILSCGGERGLMSYFNGV